jgi:hypothetical protein
MTFGLEKYISHQEIKNQLIAPSINGQALQMDTGFLINFPKS